MATVSCPALLFAAPASGSGKTSLVAALARLHAVRRRHAVLRRREIEIGEFVVEEIAVRDQLAAENAFDRRGHRHDVAVLVDHDEMRRPLLLDRRRRGARPGARRGTGFVMAGGAEGRDELAAFGEIGLVDQPGNQLDQPRCFGLAQRADAELLDQHHFITLRVVGQHTDCIMSYKHLTTDLATHASGKEFVSQMHPIKLVKTLITVLALYDLDGAWPGLGDVSHYKPLAGEFHRGRALGIAHPNAPETRDAASFITRG